ncbi:MAG: VOC family protein [Gammaproteobacteria bacterium]|nr:VOC family protein [Gammaproteobacteria bacterium]
MRITRLHQVAAHAGEPDDMCKFYRDVLGARFIAEFNPPGILFFDFNGVRLMFEANAAPATLYFWVDDVEGAHAELAKQGVSFEGEPHMIHRDEDGVFDNPGTEEWMAFFKDPGGNTLAIASRR